MLGGLAEPLVDLDRHATALASGLGVDHAPPGSSSPSGSAEGWGLPSPGLPTLSVDLCHEPVLAAADLVSLTMEVLEVAATLLPGKLYLVSPPLTVLGRILALASGEQ